MTTELVIVGIGDQGRACLAIADAMIRDGAPMKVRGFVDDSPTPVNRDRIERQGYPLLGNFAAVLADHRDAEACLGIGNGRLRRALDAQLTAQEVPCATLVHPDSTIGPGVEIEPGCVVFAGARLTTNIRAGRHVHINQNVTIGHDTTLGNFVSLNPLAAVSGDCTIADEVMRGVGAVVLQGVSVGAGSVVGGSACVVRDVPPNVTVKGVPAG
jgi:sugar O-acyltransferase (sialic acid O-acetyltransferase NeuD family)